MEKKWTDEDEEDAEESKMVPKFNKWTDQEKKSF